jgi:hypothetical protein
VRRERLFDKEGRNLLDYIGTKRYTIIPRPLFLESALPRLTWRR